MSSNKSDEKERRKRKSKTKEVSSPSPSSNESERLPSHEDINEGQILDSTMNEQISDQIGQDTAPEEQDQTTNVPPKPPDPEQAFDEFYLKQATKEFSSDLDKLRSAGDFNERSVPMIIEALKQGKACFSDEERRRIGGAGG